MDINYENLLNVLVYSGGKAEHKTLFETYLHQAEPQILKNFLKFTTGLFTIYMKGSSSIPFDRTGFHVKV